MRIAHVGRVRRSREDGEDVADAMRIGIGQVEAAPILPVDMGEMVERRDDEVDRNQIDAPALECRCSAAKAAAILRIFWIELEEIIGPVDLVHLAGLANRRRRCPADRYARAGGIRRRTTFSASCLLAK